MKPNIAVLLALVVILFAACTDEPVSRNTAEEVPKLLTKADKGELVYKQYCQSCHKQNVDLLGPALKDAIVRWDNDTVRLKSFIRNSGKAIADGDPRAKMLYEQWKTNMTTFSNLTDEELDNVIAWMQH